ncbi:ribonuclease HII [Candidatus Woesearchaeota archaeon]|nr:ribonuclease HII [Candidatus Woesearchaeota archaeon]
MLIAGIDEAGRGPVIGPMVMAIAAIDEKDVFELETFGITDSKAFSPEERKALIEKVKQICEYEVEIVTPKHIDEAVTHPSRNLNILEAEIAGKLIDKLIARLGAYKIKHVILDCPSTNPKTYLEEMKHHVKRDVQLIVEHKADLNHRIVGAASVLAKVVRDEEIEKLKKEHDIDFGSGYPSDEKTARFVKEHYTEYDFFRKTWETYKRAAGVGSQRTLGTFAEDLSKPVREKQKQLLSLLQGGFVQAPAKGVAEVLRLKKPGCTITLYRNGKVLVQGKEKDAWQKRVRMS